MLRRRLLPRLVWLSATLLLVASLLPTLIALGRVAAAPQADGWIEVCVSAGVRWLPASALGEPARPSSPPLPSLQHCPLCIWQAQGLGLPPLPPWPALALALLPLLLRLRSGDDAPRRVMRRWAMAAARGPPAIGG